MTISTLRIGDGFTLPLDAVTQAIGIVAERACVYYLADPRTPRWPRYVGSTNNAAARARQHAKPSSGQLPLQVWKDVLRRTGLVPQLVVVAVCSTREAAYEAEWRLLVRWRRRGLCDLNSEIEGQRQRWELMCAVRLARRGRCHAGSR